MDIACKLESDAVCSCRHAFRTDIACKINFKSNFRESVDFQKNALTSLFSKMQRLLHGHGQDISFIIFFKSVASRHCSNDTKEADIPDRCWLPLKVD